MHLEILYCGLEEWLKDLDTRCLHAWMKGNCWSGKERLQARCLQPAPCLDEGELLVRQAKMAGNCCTDKIFYLVAPVSSVS